MAGKERTLSTVATADNGKEGTMKQPIFPPPYRREHDPIKNVNEDKGQI